MIDFVLWFCKKKDNELGNNDHRIYAIEYMNWMNNWVPKPFNIFVDYTTFLEPLTIFEFGGEMYSTNYKEEGYDIQPRSSLANAPTSDRMSGTVTATSMTIQGGQVTELKSITKEIKKGNVVSEQIASSTNTSASQTRKLNSSIASG